MVTKPTPLVVLRSMRGMSRAQLARRSGISFMTIAAIERGRSVNVANYRPIADALDVPIRMIAEYAAIAETLHPLRRARAEAGVSIVQLSARTGIPVRIISAIERGRIAVVDLHLLDTLARALACSREALFGSDVGAQSSKIEVVRCDGEKVRRLRIAAGYSTTQLAERAKVSQSTVSRIENSRVVAIYPTTLVRIAQALDVSTSALLRHEDER